jgi:hypothetical protein
MVGFSQVWNPLLLFEELSKFRNVPLILFFLHFEPAEWGFAPSDVTSDPGLRTLFL